MMAEAEAEARTKLRGSERRMDKLTDEIQEFERRRTRFLRDFRQLLERELDVVIVEEGRTPLEERTIDLELGARRPAAPPAPHSDAEVELPPPADVPVDQLAAAYERSADAEQVSQREAAPSADGTSPHPPQTGPRRQDNLLLYLDTDEPAGG
jgi:hypothetical protein